MPTVGAGPSFFKGSLDFPPTGQMVLPAGDFTPLLLKGIKLYPESPLRFDFILDTGDAVFEEAALQQEAEQLIKYFLVSVTVPEEDLWVNLSPYEENKIIPKQFGETEMGRDLLAQDYVLKQMTASLMHPEYDLGKEFWKRIYEKAQQLYGISEAPLNNFNKVWIVPEKAVVHVKENFVLIVEAKLKVMLEQDYLARQRTGVPEPKSPKTGDQVITHLIREIILPEIEKEVNEGQNFAQLRQIYHSVILAAWFKRHLRESILGIRYADQNKIVGVEVEDKEIHKKIYETYLKAFEKGVYNFIREDYDASTKEVVTRKYFAGGTHFQSVFEGLLDESGSPGQFKESGDLILASTRFELHLPNSDAASIASTKEDVFLRALRSDELQVYDYGSIDFSSLWEEMDGAYPEDVFRVQRRYLEEELAKLKKDRDAIVLDDLRFDRSSLNIKLITELLSKEIFQHAQISGREIPSVLKETIKNAVVWGNRNKPGRRIALRWHFESEDKFVVDIIDEGRHPIHFGARSRAPKGTLKGVHYGSREGFRSYLASHMDKSHFDESLNQYDFPLRDEEGRRIGQIIRLVFFKGWDFVSFDQIWTLGEFQDLGRHLYYSMQEELFLDRQKLSKLSSGGLSRVFGYGNFAIRIPSGQGSLGGITTPRTDTAFPFKLFGQLGISPEFVISDRTRNEVDFIVVRRIHGKSIQEQDYPAKRVEIRQVIQLLDAIIETRIVDADFHPSSVMLDEREGRAYLTDVKFAHIDQSIGYFKLVLLYRKILMVEIGAWDLWDPKRELLKHLEKIILAEILSSFSKNEEFDGRILAQKFGSSATEVSDFLLTVVRNFPRFVQKTENGWKKIRSLNYRKESSLRGGLSLRQDSAQLASDTKGGIAFENLNLDVQNQDKVLPDLYLKPVSLEFVAFDGLTPVIMYFSPIRDLPLLMRTSHQLKR